MIFRRHRWHGETGKTYRFRITMTDKGLPEGGGVYVFVRRRFVFWLQALYVGKAANFRGRLIGHERWREAWHRKGATERHVLVLKDRDDHARVEEDLIRGLTPVMNDIHIPRGRKDAPNDRELRQRWRKDRRAKPLFGLLG